MKSLAICDLQHSKHNLSSMKMAVIDPNSVVIADKSSSSWLTISTEFSYQRQSHAWEVAYILVLLLRLCGLLLHKVG